MECKKIKFSVLMSVYCNSDPNSLVEAVKSVINQSLPPNQIVIVVDGPISVTLDNSIKLLSSEYKFVNCIYLPNHVGLGMALQRGVKECKFDYIARMDTDDISCSDRFFKEINVLKRNPSIDVVGSWALEFSSESKNIIGLKKVPEFDKYIKKFAKKRCPFCHMSVMIKKDALIKAGSYQDWYYAEDWYLWIRMMIAGAVFYNIQEPLVKVRMDTSSYERRHGLKYFKSIKSILHYLKENQIIGNATYFYQCFLRFIGQVLFPKKIESFIYTKILRKKYYE